MARHHTSPPALAHFLAQFADAVFAQWREAAHAKERFWLDAAFLRSLLEDAAAKLPRSAALKAQLQRELAPAATELRSLLDARYAAMQSAQEQQATAGDTEKQSPLFSEEDVERALATVDDAERRELSARLALDDDLERESGAGEGVARIEALVAQLQLLCGRAYESDAERRHKRALILQRVVHTAEPLVRSWAARGTWDCAAVGTPSEELQRLRLALQRLVVLDTVSAVASDERTPTLLAAPWSAFYRPPVSAQVRQADYDAEAAKLYGLLLTLAIYFPVVLETDATSDDALSDADSSDDDERSRAATSTAVADDTRNLDAVAQAKRTTAHVAFAAQKRTADPSWLVAVLSFVHALPKPTSYTDSDDEPALSPGDHRALQSCLSAVYTRAFSHPELLAPYASAHESQRSDWALISTVACVRHAAQFMRTEQRASVPAVTTAMSTLAGIALPASFWAWLTHVKKLFATQSDAVRDVARKLSKGKAKTMASVLLSAAHVTDAELEAVVEVRACDWLVVLVSCCRVWTDGRGVVVLWWTMTLA